VVHLAYFHRPPTAEELALFRADAQAWRARLAYTVYEATSTITDDDLAAIVSSGQGQLVEHGGTCYESCHQAAVNSLEELLLWWHPTEPASSFRWCAKWWSGFREMVDELLPTVDVVSDGIRAEAARVLERMDRAERPASYLGIQIDDRNRVADRHGFGSADFEAESHAWKLFAYLVEAGDIGMLTERLLVQLHLRDDDKASLQAFRRTANAVVQDTLQVTVEVSKAGLWCVRPLDTTEGAV
jgi:hypothetical protein